MAPLRAEKNVARLPRAFSALDDKIKVPLLIAGAGPERPRLADLAAALNIAGHVEAVERLLGWFDIFAMSSDTEQMPNSLVQAMAFRPWRSMSET